MMENASIKDWVRNCLVYHHQSGVVICRCCDTPECFRSLSTLRCHLREKHEYFGAVGVSIVNEIILSSGLVQDTSPDIVSGSGSFLLPPDKLPKCLDGLLMTQSQKQYWNAPESMSEKFQSLPAIPFLPIILGFQCPSENCFQSYQRMDSLRTHLYKQHKKSAGGMLQNSAPENVKLQSLSGQGNKRKYFPVHQLDDRHSEMRSFCPREFESEPAGKHAEAAMESQSHLEDSIEKQTATGKDAIVLSKEHQQQLPPIGFETSCRDEALKDNENHTDKSGLLRASEDHVTLPGCEKVVHDQKESVGMEKMPCLTNSLSNRKLGCEKGSAKQVRFQLASKSADMTTTNSEKEDIVKRYDHSRNGTSPTVLGRVKKVGAQVWDMVKSLNPAFKGHCARQLSAKGNKTDLLPAAATSGDDQILHSKSDHDKQGQNLFEVLCNFQELLGFLGYKTMRDVPVELVRVPRYQALRPSLIEGIGNPVPKTNVQHQEKKSGEHELDDDDDDDDDDDNDGVNDEEKRQEGDSDVTRGPALRGISRGKGKTRNAQSEEDVQLGSMLLRELGFSESIVAAQVFMYLKSCRSLTHQCSESARRLVQTRERSITGGEKRSSHDPRDRFRPVTKDSTLRDYAEEVARLVLFCLRLSVIKLVYFKAVLSEIPIETKRQYGFDECTLSTLHGLQQKHKPTLLGRSKNELQYGKLMSLIPDKVVWSAWSYIVTGTSFKRLHDEESASEENIHDSFWKSLKSLHFMLCSVLLQTVDDPASTNRIWCRHFAAISSIGSPNPIFRNRAEANEDFVDGSLETFKLKEAWQMSTLFSALLYTSSSCGLWELFHCGDTKLTYGMCTEAVRDAFCFEKNNSVSLLRELLSKAMHVLKNSDGGLNFLKCSRPGPEHSMCAWVDTVECSIPRLRKAVLSWQNRLRKILNEKLLFGMKLPAGFWEDVAGLQDHFRMVNRGFNVFSRATHETFAMRCGRLIAEHVAADSKLFYKFFQTTDRSIEKESCKNVDVDPGVREGSANGMPGEYEIRRDGATLMEYLSDCRKALDLAMILTHVVGGAPARGTELESYLLENTADSMRSFFVFHGQVILRPTHNKMRSMSGTNRNIARFLDVETSRLWVLLLAVVRPFEEALVKAKFGAESAQIQARYLFASRGKRLSASQIRITIKKEFRVEGIFFTFAQFRHWQCGIIRVITESGEKLIFVQGWGPHRKYEYCLTNNVDVVDEGDDRLGPTGTGNDPASCEDIFVRRPSGGGSHLWPCPPSEMDEQAGHTPNTADRRYAQGSHSFKGTPASKMVAFQQASRNWHSLLGLESDWNIPGSSTHFLREGDFVSDGKVGDAALLTLPIDSFGREVESDLPRGSIRQQLPASALKRSCASLTNLGQKRRATGDDGVALEGDVKEMSDGSAGWQKKKRRRVISPQGSKAKSSEQAGALAKSGKCGDDVTDLGRAMHHPVGGIQGPSKTLGNITGSEAGSNRLQDANMMWLGAARNKDVENARKLSTAISHATKQLRSMDYALSSLDQTAISRTIGVSGIPFQPVIPLKCRKQILQGLRSVLQRPDAVFSCPIQEEAIYNVLKRDRDMIVVMGTSMGKSAIFQTAAYIEGNAAVAERRPVPVIIVVVPLVALVADHLREARSIPGLKSGRWEERNDTEIQLLFISVEHACKQEFARLLVKLVNEGRLGCIFLDEGQYALLWLHFRPAFKRLGQSLHHPSIRIQRIVLSATIAPDHVDQVADVYGLVRGYCVLRQPSTIRKNLSYHVRRFKQSSFEKMEQSVLKAVNKEVRTELQRIVENVAANPEAYNKGNSFSIVDNEGYENGRDHQKNRNTPFATITKQQVMIYAPFRYLVEEVSKSFSVTKLNGEEFSAPMTSRSSCASRPPHQGQSSEACLFVCDVMTYYGSLEAKCKESNQSRWMRSAKDIYEDLSTGARARIMEIARRRRANVTERDQRRDKDNDNDEECRFSIVVVQVMVATSAFGAGINSKPVRAIIHVGSSRSMVEYVQESGRAGRDGLPAMCVVVFNNKFVEKVAKSLTIDVPDIVREISEKSIRQSESIDRLQSERSFDAQMQLSFAQHVLWLESCEQCRRTSLSAFLDVISTSACIHDKEVMATAACDFCLELQGSQQNGDGSVGRADNRSEAGALDQIQLPVRDSLIAVGGSSSVHTISRLSAMNDALNMIPPNTIQANVLRDKRGKPHASSPRKVAGVGGFSEKSREYADEESGKMWDVDSGRKDLWPPTLSSVALKKENNAESPGILEIMRDAREKQNEPDAERLDEEQHEKRYTDNQIVLENFKEALDSVIAGKCVFCLAIKGVNHSVPEGRDVNECVRKNRSCYRCFKKFCSSATCKTFPSAVPSASKRGEDDEIKATGKPCNSCGLLLFHGAYLHTWQRFGTTCPFRSAIQICLGAWYLPTTRKILIKTYNLSKDWDTNSDTHARLFVKWLREMDHRDEQYNFMHAFRLITGNSD